MARAKKSSLDAEEPVVVQDEVTVVTDTEPVKEKVAEKAEEKPAETKKEEKKETKTEAQNKTMGGAKRRGVKVCVI